MFSAWNRISGIYRIPDIRREKNRIPDIPDIRKIAISGRIISGDRISGQTLKITIFSKSDHCGVHDETKSFKN